MSGIPVFSVPREMNSLTWVLTKPLVYFRYRNCVYTYRILPNEDDKFTVQVSLCQAGHLALSRAGIGRERDREEEDRKERMCPKHTDMRAWLSLFLPRSLRVGVAWLVSGDPTPLGKGAWRQWKGTVACCLFSAVSSTE